MNDDGTVVVTARITVACVEADALFAAALATATRDGVADVAYRQARARSAHPECFDVETILRHAVTGSGGGVRQYEIERVGVEVRRHGYDDLMHVESTARRDGRRRC